MVTDLLAQCRALGATLAPGDNGALLVSPPGVLPDDLKAALRTHKPEVLKLLTGPAPGPLSETPCPACGATDWWHGPDGTTACHACLLAGREPVAAVKVHSDVLDADLWVVSDGVPPEQWPQDGAAVYTREEVKILRQVGPDTLAWVHAVKEAFGGRVVSSRKPLPATADSEIRMDEGTEGADHD